MALTQHRRRYRFVTDDQPGPGEREQSIVVVRVVDEQTGDPIETVTAVETDLDGLSPRVAAGGIVGLVASPVRNLRTLDYDPGPGRLTVRARGYLPRSIDFELARDTSLPLPLMPLVLHRLPVVLVGRVTRNRKSVAEAQVRISGYWQRLPDPVLAPAAEPPHLIGILPGLHSNRATGAVVRRREITESMGRDWQLPAAVPSGAARIMLPNRGVLQVGHWVRLGPGDPERQEYHAVAGISGTAPAEITLDRPTALLHRAGTVVRRVELGARGPDNDLDREAIGGDSCLFLTAMDGLDTGTHVEVAGGVQPVEIHRIARFSDATDRAGYFRLPPVSRVAQVSLEARDGGLTAPFERTFNPDYGRRVNRIDLVTR